MARKTVPGSDLIYWRWHRGESGIRRVWNDNWPGDVFELVEPEDWEIYVKVFNRLGIGFKQADD